MLVLIYYFRKYKATGKGAVWAVFSGFAMLGVLNFIFIPGVAKVAGWFELLFVNKLGLPYNSGLYFYLFVLAGLVVFGIWYSIRKKMIILNYVMTVVAVLILGYSSFALIIIRANASPLWTRMIHLMYSRLFIISTGFNTAALPWFTDRIIQPLL